ncbi:Flagellar basal body-associated protein FliL [Micromonospora pallida]|uniref:Flagellar basal body-associated protein FliL n=1 Tax=Micromonospora pallida TaxID=145854 RepID=A0A1C6STP1_9ACTN|nr:hypothetical protein [Micromonospora pallida]SCL33004.1 Flagellar basal body-associated protein FliL [Micromonospora pallida]
MSQPHHPPQPESGSAMPQPGSGPATLQPESGAATPQPESGAASPPSGAPGQPYRTDPAAGFPPPPKKSGVGRVLLIVLAVVLVLCVGGGIAVWATVKDDVGEVVEATGTRVVAPETLNGRPRITDPDAVVMVEEIRAEIVRNVPQATNTVVGVYGDMAKGDVVLVVGLSALIDQPEEELDAALRGVSAEFEAGVVVTVGPGPLGGIAKCGDGSAEDVGLGFCLWADRGSLGMVIGFSKTGKEVEREFAAIRAAIEQRD